MTVFVLWSDIYFVPQGLPSPVEALYTWMKIFVFWVTWPLTWHAGTQVSNCCSLGQLVLYNFWSVLILCSNDPKFQTESFDPDQTQLLNIRTFNGREVQIENSVTRVTVWHHEACRVMPNSYLEWRNFQFAPNSHYGFFFLITLSSSTAFKLSSVLICQFYAKKSTFLVKKCSVRLLPSTFM